MSSLIFVIHKHDATSLHYDFRLEINGVMPSWAIPKGLTLDPKMKRLAMKVDDHDLEYRHFEGVIPKGQYGAGPVMIWNEGTYIPEIEVAKGFPPGRSKNAWLLIKHNDQYSKKGYDASDLDFSAKSKKSLKEIEAS